MARVEAIHHPLISRMNSDDPLSSLLHDSRTSSPWWLRSMGGFGRLLPARWRFGERYGEFRRLALESETWSLEEIHSYQLKQLRQTLIQAGNYCPFYQQKFAQAAFRPDALKSLDDLRECPHLQQRELREHLPDLVSSAFPTKARLAVGREPDAKADFYFHDGVSLPKEHAFQEAQWKRVGWLDGARVAVIGGLTASQEESQPLVRRDPLRNALVLSSTLLAPERWPELVAEINSFRPAWLHVSPLAGRQLLTCLESAGQGWEPSLRGVLCGPARLTLAEKQALERGLQCRVHRWYGPAERGVLAGEGRNSTLLYFWPTYGFVEFGSPNADGWCEVISTSFHNLVTPLIRYHTGDFVRLADPRRDGDLEFPWPAVSEVACLTDS